MILAHNVEKSLVAPQGQPLAAFVCPGHPLLDSVIDLTLEPMSGGTRLERAFGIAERVRVSIYDAVYLSLAEEMRAPIATLDARMAEAARELGIRAVPGR